MSITADSLTWAATGAINSRDHVAVIEPYQNSALCGTGIASTTEIRPKTPNLCPRCARELKRLGIDPTTIGIENELTATVGRTNLDRALNGREIAMDALVDRNALDAPTSMAPEDYESGLVDALTNLMHFARRYDLDFDQRLDEARRHHDVEARYAWEEVPEA